MKTDSEVAEILRFACHMIMRYVFIALHKYYIATEMSCHYKSRVGLQ